MGSALSRLPITLILALSAFFELMLNRIGTHLLSAELRKTDPIARLIDQAGLFFFYETGFLALVLFTWAAIVMIRDRHLLRIPERMLFTFLSALFVPLATMGMIVKLPKAVAPHLNTAFVLLLVVLLVGFLRRPAPLRAKLGVIYLSAPLLLHGYWLATQQLPALAPSSMAELPIQLFEIAEHLLVVGAFAAFLFFAPFPRRANLFSPIPVTIAALTTAGVALFVRYQYPEAVQAAYHGLGINIPPPSVQVLMHLSAFFVFVLTICALVIRGPQDRSIALGLTLVALSGFQLQLPYQLLLTLSGMMLLMRASLTLEGAREPRPLSPAVPAAESWNGYLPRLAVACARPAESGEAILLQNDGQQIGQVRGQRDGLPFSLRIQQGASALQRLEVSLGEVPSEPPPIALERRRGLRGGRPPRPSAVEAPRGRLGVAMVDRHFEVHDATGRAPALLSDPDLEQSLLELCHGWLGLWPGRGLLYLAVPGRDGWPLPLAELTFSPELAQTDACEALIALLRSLARRLEVQAAATEG